MKRKWKFWLGVAVTAGLVRPAWGQVPVAPAPVAAPPPPAAAVVVPGQPAPLPGGMMGNLITTCNYCKAKFCASQFGLLINNSLLPVGVFSGGIVPPCCPPNAVNPADLLLPPDSPAGAAARIKADEAGAAARRAAVRYLAHADCHYWPEAQAALITALRADRNECVRLEAALALQTGCCCNPATILALSICVEGSEEDGNPGEISDRVRANASIALANCLSRVPPAPPIELLPEPVPPPKEKEKEKEKEREGTSASADPNAAKPAGGKGAVTAATYYQRAEGMSTAAVIRKARQALEQNKLRTPVTVASRSSGLANQGLVAMAMNAMGSPYSSAPTAAAEVAAAPQAPAPSVSPEPRRVETVKDSQPVLVPVPAPAHQPVIVPAPAPAHQPAAPPAPAPSAALPVISTTSPTVTTVSRPMTPRPAPASPSVADLTSILERGTVAADRKWAAAQLETVNWHATPQVVMPLLMGARSDPDPGVRLACLGTLARLNVDTPEVVTTYHTVAAVDGDARVRDAALHALARVRPEQHGNPAQH